VVFSPIRRRNREGWTLKRFWQQAFNYGNGGSKDPRIFLFKFGRGLERDKGDYRKQSNCRPRPGHLVFWNTTYKSASGTINRIIDGF